MQLPDIDSAQESISTVPHPPPNSSLQRLWPPKSFLIISGLIFLLLLISLTVAGISVYSNTDVPLISTKQQQSIARFFYRLPLLPKTPEMILLAAIEESTQPTSYRTEFSFSAGLGSTGVGAASLDLQAKGPIDFTNGQKLSFDLGVDVAANLAGVSYNGSGQVRKVEDIVYLKIDRLSDNLLSYAGLYSGGGLGENNATKMGEIRQNLKEFYTNWLAYDTAGLESEARRELEKRAGSQSLIETTRTKTQEFLARSEVLPEMERLADEEIAGVASYHLRLVPSRELMQQLAPAPQPNKSGDIFGDVDGRKLLQTIINDVDSLQIDAWFGKQDTILRRFSIQLQINLADVVRSILGSSSASSFESFLGQIASPKLSVSTVLTIADVGQPVQVAVPAKQLSPTAYMQKLQDALKTEEQKRQEAERKMREEDFSKLSSALTKYYVENRVYPEALANLVGSYIASTDGLVTRLGDYNYRVSQNKSDFIVYVEEPTPSLYAPTPYYGITSKYSYSRSLSKDDFDLVQ